jgi:hypothetical protein
VSAYTDRCLVTTITVDNGLEIYDINSCFLLTESVPSRLTAEISTQFYINAVQVTVVIKGGYIYGLFNDAFTVSDPVASIVG